MIPDPNVAYPEKTALCTNEPAGSARGEGCETAGTAAIGVHGCGGMQRRTEASRLLLRHAPEW